MVRFGLFQDQHLSAENTDDEFISRPDLQGLTGLRAGSRSGFSRIGWFQRCFTFNHKVKRRDHQ